MLLALTLQIGVNLYAGMPFPTHMKVLDTEGKEVTLENLRGKKAIVAVYTSSMPDCRERMERFIRLSERFVGKEVRFSAIDITPRGTEDFLKNLPADLKNVIFRKGVGGNLGPELGVKLIPTTFFLSPEGTIAGKFESIHHWDSEGFTEKVKMFIFDEK